MPLLFNQESREKNPFKSPVKNSRKKGFPCNPFQTPKKSPLANMEEEASPYLCDWIPEAPVKNKHFNKIEINLEDQEIEKIEKNDYKVIGKIGNGSFGNVYKCENNQDKNLYAIKCLKRLIHGKNSKDELLKEV